MYQSAFYDRKTNLIHLWDDTTGYEKFPYERYAYIADKSGTHITMDDVRVKRTNSWNKNAEEQGLVYEHDVPILTRVLVDRYYMSDDVSKNHRVMFLDIEVAKEGRHSTPKEAANTITAISYYLADVGYVCLLLDTIGELQSQTIDVNTTAGSKIRVNLQIFKNEKMLLTAFVSQFTRIRPTITSHWNGELYDMPYLVNRIKRELGAHVANKLSEIGIVYTEDINERDQKAVIAGVSCLDYLNLYKKFMEGERPRHTLDYISKLELGRGKISYSGSLDSLYTENVNKFIEYNVNDVELVVELDRKFNFIAIAMALCHSGCVPYEDIRWPTRYLEGAALVYCKQNNVIALTTQSDEIPTKAKGAFVKPPKVGLFNYVGSVDLQSQYPMSIISQNISPETKFGRVLDWDNEEFARNKVRTYRILPKKNRNLDKFDITKSEEEFVVDNLREWLTQNQMCISAIGVIYRMDRRGLIPSILDRWFNQRKHYKKLAAQFKDTDHSKYEYYDRRQYIQKILLNSFYGAMLETNFRFYDKENGESTTQTGFNLIHYTSKIINLYCNKITGKDEDYVVYNDTDSAYFLLMPLLESKINFATTNEDDIIREIAIHANAIEELLNNSYSTYAYRYHNLNTHNWVIKQEKIARRAFWGSAKKRYGMWVIMDEGNRCNKPIIKGFDNVRSDFPAAFREFFELGLSQILQGKNESELIDLVLDFKSKYDRINIMDILTPEGVKHISKYKTVIKGIPIHVSAALNYNKFIVNLNLSDQYPSIMDGDKIAWGYLRQNPYNFRTLGIRGYDDPVEIVEYLSKYLDTDHIFSGLISKLQSVWDDLGWHRINLSEDHQDFF
jgi:DNA polymerase elongation subunit (family B)